MVGLVGRADHVLAIDQGTTSTRAILFDPDARAVAVAQRELEQHYPAPGWVEHDPEQIWQDALAVANEVLPTDRAGWPQSESQISEKRSSSGIERRANPCIRPLSGRTGVPRENANA